MATTMTVKGQVTIPKNMRDFLGLRPGDQVNFEFVEDGSIRMRPVGVKKRKVKDHFGPLVGARAGGESTDALMDMLRGYSQDQDDPGFR